MARVCQVSPATVANWIDQGLLKGHKTPTGRRRVEAEDLSAFLKAHDMSVPPELQNGNGPAVVVVVDDDPGYLKAMVLTIERSDLDVEVAGPERAAGDPAAAGAGSQAGRRGDRGDGGDAGAGDGGAAAHGGEGDPQQVGRDAGGGGCDAGGVAAAQGGVELLPGIDGFFGCVG